MQARTLATPGVPGGSPGSGIWTGGTHNSVSDGMEPGSLTVHRKDMVCSVMDGGIAVTHDGHTMTGWLTKKGGVRKNWLKRWFKLNDVHRTLEYYDQAGQNQACGTINLAKCSEARASLHPTASKLDIELESADRTYCLRAPNEEAFRAWLAAIQAQLDTYDNTAHDPRCSTLQYITTHCSGHAAR